MLFNSFHFILFFIIVVVMYYLLPYRFRWILLLIASYYFYICWRPKELIFILLIIFSTFVNYIFSIAMYRQKNAVKRKRYLFITLFINFGLLFLFKYAVFLNESFMNIISKAILWYYRSFGAEQAILKSQFFLEHYPARDFDIILPMGISFYTFQATAYSIDVYRRQIKPIKHYGIFSLFITFFPQLVAGPIERSRNLLPQFYKKHTFQKENVLLGLKWMLWGFFKKIVIADRVSTAVNTIYNAAQSYSGFYFVFATILFAFQIYCDFSGYSDIAFGSAKVLGFDLMHNFEKPYLSKSIKELWRRWHISLSTWFMDYIYIPLGGNKKGKLRKCFNLFITFLLFCASLIIFRANTISDAVYIFQHIFDNIQQWTNAQYIYEITTSMGINLFELTIVLLSILILILLEIITAKDFVITGVEKTNCVLRLAFYVFLTVWILSTGVFYNSGEFIYFQF